MTTTDTDTGLKPCACGCGTLVKGTWAKGHWAKAQKANREAEPLPAPDDDLGADEIPAELQAEIDALEAADREQDEPPPEELTPDRPAGRLREPRRTTTTSGRRIRVTATIRKDIEAKIRFVLVPAGQIWAARDPICGGTFAHQEPLVSESLAEIVCDSPDLVAWFTGPAGGFMKYFKLAAALQPVGMAVWAHHVTHAVAMPEDAQQPPQHPAYAA